MHDHHHHHHRHHHQHQSQHHHHQHQHPPPWPHKPNPTPYDIFAIARTEAYPKKRFYQLVKLYHPDLSHAAPAARVPPDVRLERYRLVVAANSLLSDPAKRRAYDMYGAGWGLGGPAGSASRQSAEEARRADRSWRQRPGNASRNATWEDWEAWYEARGEGQAGRPRQETQYMPNGVFAMLLAMTCIIGAMLQGQRAGMSGSQVLELADQRDRAVGGEMRRSSVALAGMSKDQRVDRFLRDRENVAFQFSTARYDDALPPPESDKHHGHHR